MDPPCCAPRDTGPPARRGSKRTAIRCPLRPSPETTSNDSACDRSCRLAAPTTPGHRDRTPAMEAAVARVISRRSRTPVCGRSSRPFARLARVGYSDVSSAPVERRGGDRSQREPAGSVAPPTQLREVGSSPEASGRQSRLCFVTGGRMAGEVCSRSTCATTATLSTSAGLSPSSLGAARQSPGITGSGVCCRSASSVTWVSHPESWVRGVSVWWRRRRAHLVSGRVISLGRQAIMLVSFCATARRLGANSVRTSGPLRRRCGSRSLPRPQRSPSHDHQRPSNDPRRGLRVRSAGASTRDRLARVWRAGSSRAD